MEHARGLSTRMGALAGATAGGIFGAVWGMAGQSSIAVRAATLAAIGGITGFILSNRTWNTTPHMQAPEPINDTDFLQHPGQASPQHAAKIHAERAVQAEVSQAL